MNLTDLIARIDITGKTAAEVADLLNAKTVERLNPLGTKWSNAGIDAAFPSDYLSGQLALGLEGAVAAMRADAANDGNAESAQAKRVAARTFEGYISTMENAGVDFANTDLRARLDLLQGMGKLTADCVTKLKGMGIQHVSPCENVGLPDATDADVQNALIQITANLNRQANQSQCDAVQALIALNPSLTPEGMVERYARGLLSNEQADAIKTLLGV